MSVRDTMVWSEDRRAGESWRRDPMSELADRLAAARRAGEPAPEELERVVELLARSDRRPSPRLIEALEGLARWSETSRAARPADTSPPPTASLRAALAEISERQKILDAEDRPAPPRPLLREAGPARPAAGEAVVPAAPMAELRAEIDRLGRSVSDLPTRREVDGLAREMGQLVGRLSPERPARLDPASLGAIGALVGEIDRMRAEAASPRMIADLAEELHAISGRLDILGPSSAGAVEALSRRIDEVRAELRQFPRAASVDALAGEIRSLVARLDDQERAAAPAREAVVGLVRRVETLDGRLSAIAQAPLARHDALERVGAAIRAELEILPRAEEFHDLGRRIGALAEAQAADAERLAQTMRDELAAGGLCDGLRALSGRIEGLDEQMQAVAEATGDRDAAVERIERSIRGVAERLAAPSGAWGAPNAGSAALEAEVSRLVDGLERNDGRLDDLGAAFARLAARIERSCGDLAPPVSDVAPERQSDDALEDELARSLAGLAASAAEGGSAGAAPAGPPDAPQESEPASRPEAELVADIAAPASATNVPADDALAPRPAEESQFAFVPDLDDSAPIEAGKPQAVASKTDAGAGRSAASFIAAARRAAAHPASGASDFTGAASEGADRPDDGGRPKSRKRPVLLGLAAILIALATAAFVVSGIAVEQAGGDASPTLQSRLLRLFALPPPAPPPSALPPTADAPPAVEATRAAAVVREEAPAVAAPALLEQITAPVLKSAVMIAPRATARELAGVSFAAASAPPGARGFEWKAADPVAAPVAMTGSGGLPDAIGGPRLRMRAAAGDPSAQLEVADRLLEGRNVEPDAASAAVWLERAAAQGLAPAQLRLGSLYEKGRGVARDVVAARRWYEQAAASGNVRAMHNLGVLYAEGGLGKPDYAAAAVWFRMAAERGLVDGQYNIAVLTARGPEGKRDLVEAYKWFALAAAQGDEDAAKKREEVGRALGPRLAAAKAEVEAFHPRGVDAGANEVPTPPGGWDRFAERRAVAAAR